MPPDQRECLLTRDQNCQMNSLITGQDCGGNSGHRGGGAHTDRQARRDACPACMPREILGCRATRCWTGPASTRPWSSRSRAAASPRRASRSSNVTRTSWLHAGLPNQTGCLTLDAQCGSAQQAAHLIAGLIAAGAIEAGVACGVEAMSRVPLGSAAAPAAAPRGRPPGPSTCRTSTSRRNGSPSGAGLSRAEVDAFGLASQQAARRPGRRAGSTGRSCRSRPRSSTPSRQPTGETAPVDRDQGLRETSMDALARLRPVVDRRPAHGRHLLADLRRRGRGTAGLEPTGPGHSAWRRAPGSSPSALIGAEPYYHLDGPVAATERVLDAAA